MTKLIVDVTYLAHWQGRLTGIPRVINELVERYKKVDNTLFVVWDNQYKSFYEVDIDKTLVDRGKKLHYKKINEDSSPASSINRSKLYSAKALRKLKNTHKVPVPSATIDYLFQNTDKQYIVPIIEPGDKILLTMGEWGNKSYIDKVTDYKLSNKALLVQVIYDVLPLVQPQYSGHSTDAQREYITQIIPLCSLVLAISEHTKKDLTKWLQTSKLKVPSIEVFRLGDDFKFVNPSKPDNAEFQQSRLTGNDYLLCVGTIEARKNHTLLYYVYKLAKQKGIELPKLVIVGRLGWMADNLYGIATTDPDVTNSLIFLTDTSDEELSWLYQHAILTVYPSFYEGWGLPIAESVVRGVPCVASNTSSMPEIAGDLIEYFNPVSTDECLAAIQKLLLPEGLKDAKKRIKKYKPATWDQTFDQVHKHIGRI